MLHQKFFNDETIDAPVDIRIIAGINDIILHTRPAVAIPRPACFFSIDFEIDPDLDIDFDSYRYT